MNTNSFKLNKLAATLSVALAAASAPQMVYAQQGADEQVDETITVRGIRGSLMRSMDLKRDSSGIMDAISAEEMGKFPDTNLAESLQRITGVTISRSNGEGSEITVRGFGPHFNLVTLNGRQMPGTGFTRSFNFENLSSEGVSSLEVVKTSRAETPTGGLGATVNIVTPKPLQSKERTVSLMAKAIHDSSNVAGDDITPEFAGLYSDTFMDDTFGVAANFSYNRRDFQQQGANIQGWHANADLPSSPSGEVIDNRAVDENGEPVKVFTDYDKDTGEPFASAAHFFPKDMNYGYADVQRERINGQVALQFKPTDNMVITADYTGTRATTAVESIGWGIWNNFGGNINGYELDANGTAIYADISGDDGSFAISRSTTEVESDSIGLNLDWQLTDSIHIELDVHDSQTKVDNGADKGIGGTVQMIMGSDQLINKVYDYRTGDIPHYWINWENGSQTLNTSEIDSNFGQFIHSPGKATVQQAQLDVTWTNEGNGALIQLKGGASFTKQELSGSNAWSGLRGGPGFNPSFTQIFADELFTKHGTGSFLDQFAGGGDELSPNYYYTFDLDKVVGLHSAYVTAAAVGDANAFSTDPYDANGTFSTSLVEEETTAVYVQSQWEFELGDYLLEMNAGVRYESTDVISPSESKLVDEVVWASGSEWITRYQGDAQLVSNSGGYDIVLPMVDLKLELTDDFVTRLSLGKSMARPELGYLLGGTNYSGSPKIGARTASGGNTNLKPYQSTNLDLSFEYYYQEDSYLSVGLFAKKVEDWIEGSVTEDTIDGVHDVYKGQRYNTAVAAIEADGQQADTSAIYDWLIAEGYGDENGAISADPATDPILKWSLSTPLNVEERNVHGAEFAVQHVFGDSGFGTSLNFTLVDGDVEYDPYELKVQSVLPGISDSANFQMFYEKDGLSVKATYAWRDAYLIGQGQSQGSAEAPPQFAKSFAQWDMSINYDVTDNLTVFFDGVNLNNETEQGYGRFEEQFLFARQYGPRYIVGARIKL